LQALAILPQLVFLASSLPTSALHSSKVRWLNFQKRNLPKVRYLAFRHLFWAPARWLLSLWNVLLDECLCLSGGFGPYQIVYVILGGFWLYFVSAVSRRAGR
jgi:hypothetical protein